MPRKLLIYVASILIYALIYIFLGKNNNSSELTNNNEKYATELSTKYIKQTKPTENRNNTTSSNLTSELEQQVLHDIGPDGDINNQSLNSAGFSDYGTQKIRDGGAISIKDMPPELQDVIKHNLTEISKNGFETISEEKILDIVDIENKIAGVGSDITNLSFKPSLMPKELSSGYNYVGYAFEQNNFKQPADGKSDTVRRVYKSLDSSSTLVIEESSLTNGSSNLVSEFVNDKIGGHPAIYSVKRSDSGKSYSMLTWSGQQFSYSIYRYGSNNAGAQKILTDIGQAINTANNN